MRDGLPLEKDRVRHAVIWHVNEVGEFGVEIVASK